MHIFHFGGLTSITSESHRLISIILCRFNMLERGAFERGLFDWYISRLFYSFSFRLYTYRKLIAFLFDSRGIF